MKLPQNRHQFVNFKVVYECQIEVLVKNQTTQLRKTPASSLSIQRAKLKTVELVY